MIGCLIAAAALAVVTVLIGEFNEVLGRSLFTIALIALHCFISFSFIVNNEKQKTFDSLTFFTNVTFIIIILSFITSVFGTWTILAGWLVLKLYGVYFVLLFATLHGETLSKTTGKQSAIDNTVYANYCFMFIVVVMLMMVIFLSDSADVLGPIFYRFLAAFGIIDATLTLIAIIAHKLYVQKHPTPKATIFSMPLALGQVATNTNPGQLAPQQAPKRHMNIFVILILIYAGLQFLGAIVVGILGKVSR